MKKLTKSAKIILVSVISAVCVLAIVLGAIFATRGKNPSDPNNPNNPVEKPLTWAEKVDLLGKEINEANNTTSYDIVLGVPYDGYVDDEHILSEIGKNYFIISLDETDINNLFYFYTTKSDGSFNVINLTSKKSDGGCGEDDATSFSVKTYDEKYVILESSGSEHDYVFSVVDISGTSPKISYTYKTTEIENEVQSIYDSVKISSDNKTIFFSLRVYDRDSETSNEKFNITYYLVSLQNKQLFELDTYGYDDETEIYYSFQNNSLAINFNGTVRIYVITNKLYTYLVSALEGYKYSTYYYLYDKQFLIEYYKQETKSTLSDNSVIDDDTGNIGNYKYQLLSLENSKNELLCSDYSLDEKIAKLQITNYSSFYSILEKKVDSEHKYSGENKITYYYKDGLIIISYTYETKNDSLIFLNSKKLLTKYTIRNIISADKNETIYKFENQLVSNVVTGNIFAIRHYDDSNTNVKISFMDLDGNIVYDASNFNEYFSSVDGFKTDGENYLIKSRDDRYFKFNIKNQKIIELVDINLTDNILNQILNNGYGFYFINENNRYSFNSIKEENIINFSNYEFMSTLKNNSVLKIDGSKLLILKNVTIDNNKNVSNYSIVNKNEINEITPFGHGFLGAWSTGYITYYSQSDSVQKENENDWWGGAFIDVVSLSDLGWSAPSGWTFVGWADGDNDLTVSYNKGYRFTGDDYFHKYIYAVFSRNVQIEWIEGTERKTSNLTQYRCWGGGHSTNIQFSGTMRNNATYWTFKGFTTNAKNSIKGDSLTNSETISVALDYTSWITAVYSRKINIKYNVGVKDDNMLYGDTANENDYETYANAWTNFESVKVKYNDYSRVCYVFDGWYSIEKKSKYNPNDNFTFYTSFKDSNSDFNFNAQWKETEINIEFIFATKSGDSDSLMGVKKGVANAVSLKDLGIPSNGSSANGIYNLDSKNNIIKSEVFKFTYNSSYTLNSLKSICSNEQYEKLFKYRETYIKCNSIENVPCEIIGWVLGTEPNNSFDYYYNINPSNNNVRLYSYSEGEPKKEADINLNQYIRTMVGGESGWHDKCKNGETTTIVLYAYYSPRPYYVYTEAQEVDGASLIQDNEFYEYGNGASTKVSYEFGKIIGSNNETVDFGVNSTGYNIGLGSELKLKISLKQPDSRIDTIYSFGRIELKYYPYKSGNSYSTMTAIFYINFNSGSGIVTSNLSGNSKDGFYHSSSPTTNIVKFTEDIQYNNIIITISNVGLASSTKGKTPTEDSVGSTGQQGFTIKAYAVAGYTNSNETSSFVDRINISGNYNGYNSINNTNNPYGFAVTRFYTEGSYKYFWLNSRKYYFVLNNNETYKVLKSSTDIKIKDDNGRLNASKIKTPYNQEEKDIDCTIIVNGNYVFIISNNGNLNSNYIVPNYGSSEFYAIEPKQDLFNQMDSNGKIINKVYELKSYISKIVFPSGLEIDLSKPTKMNSDNSGYNTIVNNFLGYDFTIKDSFSKSPFNKVDNNNKPAINNYGYFEYSGEKYYIIDMQEYADRTSYHLYFGVNVDNGKYMYFIVGQDVNGGEFKPTNDIKSINITFTDIESKIQVNTSGIDGDTYIESNTNGLHIKYGNSDDVNKDGNINLKSVKEKKELNNNFSCSGIKPTDAYLFQFSPISGYLINTVTVKIGSHTVLNFTLKQNGIVGGFETGQQGIFSYYVSSTGSGQTSKIVQIPYDGSYGAFNTNNIASSSSNVAGIYYKTRYDDNYNEPSANSFESFYLLVSGIYDDVTISVTTISFFEIALYENDDNTNSLFNIDGATDIEKLGKLQIAYFDNNWIKLDSDDLSNNNKNIVVTNNGRLVYRVMFFGLAGTFKNGIAFHASGENYSYSFSNGRFYAGLEKSDGEVYNPLSYIKANTGDELNNSLNNYRVSDGNTVEDETSYLYITTGKLKNFFESDKINEKYNPSGDYSGNFVQSYKYEITFKVSKQVNSITSKSWLATSNSYNYQVDDPTKKTGTWFNDTTITNIDFTNSLLKNTNTTGDKTSKNWQDVSNQNQYLVENNFGYGISFKYYVVPGYYLNAFSIKAKNAGAESLFTGVFNTEYLDSNGNGILNGSKYGILEDALPRAVDSEKNGNTHKKKISYKLTYAVDENGAYYEIQLFVNDDTNYNAFQNSVQNLGILASDIEIDIYSIQYSINIIYNKNTGNSSSKETFSFNKNNATGTETTTDTIKYDRESILSLNPSMVGYTFIGWGGDTIYSDGEFQELDRYNSDNNTWDSSSAWFDISNYFSVSNRQNLLNLVTDDISASDFYILNGKFMTDTGFSAKNTDYLIRNEKTQRPQEYNFWAAYSDIFTRDINVTKVKVGDADATYTINLYAIWKANTYMVTFDMNDSKTRGTTTTYVSGYNINSDGTISNVLGKFETISSSVILPSLGEENGYYVKYSNERLNAYITFDTNDWYVLVDPTQNDDNFYKLPYSKTNNKNITKISLSRYVIDRYGYTWLGWFSSKLDRVFEEQAYYQEGSRRASYPIIADKKDNTNNYFVYGTNAYTTKVAEKNDGEFALFNYDCIVNLFRYNASNNDSNVKEIEKSTRFLYKNLYKDQSLDNDENLNTSLDYIYFYDYSGSTKYVENIQYKYARDYLNVLDNDNFNSLDEKTSTDGLINQVLMYYDTMIDYRYYKFSTKNATGNATKHDYFGYISAESSKDYPSYRYLTLYAYWQTNSYNVNVDFRDKDSAKSTTGVAFGSTIVDKSSKNFMPVYFDDAKFGVQLSRFLPIRLGYDFIGWSFGPDSGTTNQFTPASSYVFNDTWSERLYSKDGLKIIDSGTGNGFTSENREQLGDRVGETHVIYIFAVWRAQTYSINVSLNISASKLKNLYDIDSEFAIALYQTTDNQGNILSIDDYLGINSNYLLNKSSANLSETAYSELVANLVFEITFDQAIETAVLKNLNKQYTIKKLFATSAGYYLLGWMSGDIALVSNTTNSIFAEDGKVVSGTGNIISGNSEFILRKVKGTFADGTYQFANDILYEKFDATLFDELVSSYYIPDYDYNNKKLILNYTINSSGGESGTAIGSGSIDEYYTQKLNTLDYYNKNSEYIGRYQIYDEISGSNYYTTIKKSSNASSNFGYVTENGLNYYIYTEKVGDKYVMYYIDASNESENATKWYLYPYVQLVNNNNEMQYYAANKGSELRFTYDGTNFYIDNYLVRFCNFDSDISGGTEGMIPNAYYTTSTFDNAVAIKILFMKSKISTENVYTNGTGISFGKDTTGKDIYSTQITNYKLTKTREFTIYAQWSQKEDLNVTINNGNNSINGGQTADNNYGLAGYYRVKDSSENAESRTNSFEDQRSSDGSNTNSSVSKNFEFYDKLDMFIAPYFNGRFLSEISFKFYSYEDVGLSSSTELYGTRYQKIPYILTLNFEWNSTNHMIELSKVTIKRSSKNETDVTDLSNALGGDDYLGNTIKVNTNRLTQIGKKNDIAKLSLLNRDVMYDNETSGTLLKISDYIEKVIDYNKINNFNELSNEDAGRIDVNYILMNFANVMTSIDITCKFSVQTYKLEIYNVFDISGNNLESVTGTTNYRSTNYASLTDMLVNTKSAFTSSNPLTYQGSLATTVDSETMSEIKGGVIRIATISRDCAMDTKSYDVPYGTYIYGNYYNQQIRPVDEAYDPVKRTGYDTSDYTGYSYIFQEGYYNYGNSQTKIKSQESDGVIDTYGRQCYTILGSKTLFSNSVREPSALYTFVSWFMPTTASDGGDSLEFAQYSKDWEATAFRQNLCLIGYYYANNKPTSINFYTWNDNENAYEQYTNNITEYTLQSTETKYAFKEENLTSHELVRDKNITPYIDSTDEENRMILFFRTSFGVDATKFENEDAYSTEDIRLASKDFLRNNLIRNYWFYRHYSTMVYYNDNGTRRFICYDASDDSLTHFYYTTASGKKQYLQLFSDNLSEDNFVIYANKVDSEGDKIVISENYSFIEAQKKMFKLDSYKNYSYDFYGSKMYAMVNRNTDVPNDIEKYYPIKKIEDYLSDDSLTYDTKQLISNMKVGDKYRARFYVQIKGEIYFMAVAEAGDGNISNLYTFAYNADTEKYSFTYKSDLILNATTPIANIDEYYLNVGTDYYKVNYYEYQDDFGSIYINPYVSRGSYETNTCDFEYAGTTKRIYFNYNDKTFYENYNFEDSDNNKVTTKLLGVEEFKVYTPVNSNYSVNIGLKKEDAQKWSYLGVNINSLPSPNIGFWYNNNTYGYVGYIAFTDSDISYISSTTAENMFNYTTPEFGGTRHKNERIIDVLNDYIKALYEDTGAYSPEIIKLMKEKVTAYCNDYQPKGGIFKSLITVGEFYTTYKNGALVDNVVEGVCLLIPITFELNIEYTDPQTHQTTIVNETITASVKYYINVVSDTTNIEGTIYAVPIYSRNVIEYTKKSVSVTDSILNLNIGVMNKIYFETVENMYTHFYNAKNGQYLKFAILSEEEYKLMINSNNYPDKLTYLLKDSRYSDINVFSEEDSTDGMLRIDLSGYDNGTYYVVAYYEKEDNNYAIRTSDNFIKLDIENSVIRYSLV